MSIIYVIGFLFFALALWQSYSKGTHYKLIALLSLLFVLGFILAVAGVKTFGYFLMYLFISWFLMLLLLLLASWRKYYSHIMPFIFLYAVLVALFFWFFGLNSYFWPYLVLSAVFLFFNLKNQLNSKDANAMFSHIQFEVIHGVENKELKKKLGQELDPNKTIKQHLYSGVAVYVISFIVAYYIFNGTL